MTKSFQVFRSSGVQSVTDSGALLSSPERCMSCVVAMSTCAGYGSELLLTANESMGFIARRINVWILADAWMGAELAQNDSAGHEATDAIHPGSRWPVSGIPAFPLDGMSVPLAIPGPGAFPARKAPCLHLHHSIQWLRTALRTDPEVAERSFKVCCKCALRLRTSGAFPEFFLLLCIRGVDGHEPCPLTIAGRGHQELYLGARPGQIPLIRHGESDHFSVDNRKCCR